jgi:hypothetical protein
MIAPDQTLRIIEERRNSVGTAESPSQGFDLLRVRWIRALVISSAFPFVFQAVMLIVFVGLGVLSWGMFAPQGIDDKLYAKTHLVALLIWGFWWPTMVWVAVLFGRVWCAVCPLELVANGSERLGRTLGVKQRVLGKWLRSGALIVGLYALIQMLVAGVHLHRVPAYTSFFLWGLLATAALTGFFFKDRAFCRGFCPVGLLLGTYGRGGMLAVRPTSPEQCATCTGKDCVRACNRARLDARSCPSLLNPARLNRNSDCLVCGQCIKVCDHDNVGNMGVYLRRPFPRDDVREPVASWPVTLFVMLVSGFVTSELFSEWSAAQAVFLWTPEALANSIGVTAYAGWIEAVWTLFVVPIIVWSILGVLVVVARGATNLGEAWRRLALPLAVVIAAGHMSKGLAKVVAWIGFVPLAAKDPFGMETARAIASKGLPQPSLLLPMIVVSVLAMSLILAGGFFALREARLAQPGVHRRYYAPVLAVSAMFCFIVFGWGFLQ